jgi:hypothetical protein
MFVPLASALNVPRPEPVPLSGPASVFWSLLILTFLLHVLAMNAVVGGSIAAAVNGFLGNRRKDRRHTQLSRWLYKSLPVAVAATVSLGVAPLLFAQVLYGRLLYTSSILMGWYWLAVIPILILAYYGTYLLAIKGATLGRRMGILGWIVAGLFLSIAFIYTNNMSSMLRPDLFVSRYLADGRGLTLNLDDPSLFPRFLHVLIGAIAVSGLLIAFYGFAASRNDQGYGSWVLRKGAKWFVAATALNFVIGTWFVLSYQTGVLLSFMRDSLLGPLALATGLFFALVAFGLGAICIQSSRPGPFLYGTAGCLVVTILSMVLVRDQIRVTLLAPSFRPTSWVEPQWGLITVFVGLLVLAVATIVWMVRLLVRRRSAV